MATTSGTGITSDVSSQIGKDPKNHWRYNPATGMIDLVRKVSTCSSPLTLKTTTNPIRIDPATTALLIIDMQNFFLSPALGKPDPSPGLEAAGMLLKTGIPAAREKGIRVAWVNWGLTDEEVESMPPGMMKAFGIYESVGGVNNDGNGPKKQRSHNVYKGLGADIGPIELEDDTIIEAGRVLMRDTWNAALYRSLDAEYRKGLERSSDPDVWIHKNRMSALWGSGTDLEAFLKEEGITTLLFAGVNTDQCVGGTLTDAFSKGFDCVLLKDAAATSSPHCATEAWEWNCANTFGFVSWCGALSGDE
jgi:nicotinamidase-related amidase